MQAYLAKQERLAFVLGTLAGVLFCVGSLSALGAHYWSTDRVPAHPAQPHWGDGMLCLTLFVLGVGVLMWVCSLQWRLYAVLDLRDGVYVRVTGRIELDAAKDAENTSTHYTLVVGDRRFRLRGRDFKRLWAALDGKAAPPEDEVLVPTANLAARAVVSYLAHSPMLLEVRSEAGDVLYFTQHIRA